MPNSPVFLSPSSKTNLRTRHRGCDGRTQRKIGHRADGSGIINDNDALLHRTYTQDSRLWLIDDRESKQQSTRTVLGKCERPAFDTDVIINSI